MGEFNQLPKDYISLVSNLKSRYKLSVFVGFGVKTPEDIANILTDGAIIGSEFIKRYNDDGILGIEEYLKELQGVFDERA